MRELQGVGAGQRRGVLRDGEIHFVGGEVLEELDIEVKLVVLNSHFAVVQ